MLPLHAFLDEFRVSYEYRLISNTVWYIDCALARLDKARFGRDTMHVILVSSLSYICPYL